MSACFLGGVIVGGLTMLFAFFILAALCAGGKDGGTSYDIGATGGRGSCPFSCSPGDWHAKGKCARMGCYTPPESEQ